VKANIAYPEGAGFGKVGMGAAQARRIGPAPASPSRRGVMGPSLSPLKGEEGCGLAPLEPGEIEFRVGGADMRFG